MSLATPSTKTIIAQEVCEASQAVARQLVENVDVWSSLCDRLRQVNLNFAVMIGRGSSDHACTFAKYLFETRLGLITSTAAPSAVTMYDADLCFGKALVIAISSSGTGPDICEIMAVARHKGAVTVAIVNAVDSPLAEAAEFVVPLWTGKEKSVPTKSFIASLVALTHFVALMKNDQNLQDGLKKLPNVLSQAAALKWPEFINSFCNIDSSLVISRGYGFPVAQEIALKFIETASLQAEAFSAAELLMHGRVALVKLGYPYLLLAQSDRTLLEILTLALRIKNLGGKPMLVLPDNLVYADVLKQHTSSFLILPPSLGAVFDPIVAVSVLYLIIAELIAVRSLNNQGKEEE